MTPFCGEPLSGFIAALLELAPAAAWARIVTSGSQQPRTVKSFAQCDTFFGPPSLPISIERHYKWRKQNHEFVVLGAGVFCRIDLVTTLVGPPASRTGRGTRYRTRRPGAAVGAGKLNPCQEPGTAIMGHYDRPAALHLAFVEYGLECMAPIMFMLRMMRLRILSACSADSTTGPLLPPQMTGIQRPGGRPGPIASAVRKPWSVVILMHS